MNYFGRILWHRIYLTGCLPLLFAKSILYNIIRKETSIRLITETFMDLLELLDENVLDKAWNEATSSELISEFVGLFSNYSITLLPTNSNFLECYTICMKWFRMFSCQSFDHPQNKGFQVSAVVYKYIECWTVKSFFQVCHWNWSFTQCDKQKSLS